MALPKNKGIRKITVNNQKYYWTVKNNYQLLSLVVTVGLISTPNNHFFFTLKFEDPWLAFPNKVKNEVSAITPSLIRESVLFAREKFNWPEDKAPPIKFVSGKFTI